MHIIIYHLSFIVIIIIIIIIIIYQHTALLM